ncbi:M48 family metalloprotease [Marinifilum fragile]|uniref:M48 family metalloprotease n=1 Tax=Marinifilum fragile TaxID=570161 RepID=UPI002AA8808B|nr:M48 family metalloprotease [Marinifilum fragile]
MIKKQVKLSKEFKSQTTKAILSIAFFTITYFILLMLALGITALCVFGGVMLIITIPKFITLALGVGLASLGFLILIFLLKFMFKSHKVDMTHLNEIKKSDEPELFNLIEEIVREVDTKFPKKVFLSADVNASVFYNSSFWSMFLPVRKNLQIGMGLMNTVTRQELKAILSHEFGHFSQRTMKVGSYVYNVNQVIFNMLFDNESYDRLIETWSNVSGYFSVFVVIAATINRGIQWVLRKLYNVVNKSYMGLSREMEFHADEIAANITGYEPLKSSLLRFSLADHSLNVVMNFYQQKYDENLRSLNIFKEQFFVMNFIAKDDNIKIIEEFPEIEVEDLNKFNKSKLVIKDQWASHPSVEDRVERLRLTKLSMKDPDRTPAVDILQDYENTQRAITEKIFSEIQFKDTPTALSLSDFSDAFVEGFSKNIFAEMYNGYYDSKNPKCFDIESIEGKEDVLFEELFNAEKRDLIYRFYALENDIEVIKQIINKTIPNKSFDYDGIKYTRKKGKELVEKLELEKQDLHKQIKANDIEIYKYFFNLEKSLDLPSAIRNLYINYFKFDKEHDRKYDVYARITEAVQFMNVVTPFDQIRENFRRMHRLELDFKAEIQDLLNDPLYKEEINSEMRTNFEKYISKDWQYFREENYIDDNLDMLFNAIHTYVYLITRGYFLTKKELLDHQANLLQVSGVVQKEIY